jgi:hypothetical protein
MVERRLQREQQYGYPGCEREPFCKGKPFAPTPADDDHAYHVCAR